ncbi:MAG: ribosome silencing factor [Candidatus Promineifilaceae bacterium]
MEMTDSDSSTETTFDPLAFTNLLIDVMLDKKASDILLLDVQDQVIFSDYFLICSGDSSRQIKALVDGIAKEAKREASEIPMSIEGDSQDGWMMLDYGYVVVHIFSPESREYYNLEELWQDARVVLRLQ